MKRIVLYAITTLLFSVIIEARTVEPLPYGNFDSWVTRNIKESKILGGDVRQCYAIGPEKTVDGDEPYSNRGTSPWASSNVMAKVMGITKVSTSVEPATHGSGKCARMYTKLERCRAAGIISIDVLVSGSIFLGEMLEPVKSTSKPYAKMDMGIPFGRRPVALQYDYCLTIPPGNRIYSSGFGKKRTVKGRDAAEAFIYLQRRWEDADGNIYAKRVGTGRELIGKSSAGWIKGHSLPVHYGDITGESYYTDRMGLLDGDNAYYARNSRGKMVPVHEIGWDSADATPTHMLVMFSSGSGEPYVGTPGMNFMVDNAALEY